MQQSASWMHIPVLVHGGTGAEAHSVIFAPFVNVWWLLHDKPLQHGSLFGPEQSWSSLLHPPWAIILQVFWKHNPSG